jgi:TonB-linked SusC/RagA family outer membrane protein
MWILNVLSGKSNNIRLTTFMLLFLTFCVNNSSAQNKITGIVTNINNAPLEAATITNKTTGIQILSDQNGSFSITAKSGDVIIISFIGYASKQIEIQDGRLLNVQLDELVSNLEDVVMVGYAKQKVKEITGSVAIVKPKDLTAVPAGQVEQMLQGRAAGVDVITSGMPGGGSNVRIHGIGNFGDVTPLYIIDGVPGNINNLNPYDIEGLQVLKDAGAYSIYGVRGANGVIVVTTKSGKEGKTKISYDFYLGRTSPLKGLDILNPQEQADLTWLALKNSGEVDANGNPNDPYYGNGPAPVLPDYLVAGPYTGLFEGDPRVSPDLYNIDFAAGDIYQIVGANKTGTDWFHEIFQPAVSQNHTITGSGGNNKNKYLFSLGYLDQQGTLIYTYLKRFTARINTTFSLNDKISFGENLQLSYRDNPQVATQQGANGNEIHYAITTQPILPVYDIKGNWASLDVNSLAGNPVATRSFAKDSKASYWDIFGDAWAEINFLKNFTFRTQFGGLLTYHYFYDYSLFSYMPNNNLPNNSFTESSGYQSAYTWTNTLNFSKTFNKDHTVKVLAGAEYINNYNRQLGGSRKGYFTDDVNYRFLTNGDPNSQSNYSFAGISVLSSFLSSANYQFKDKYYFTATLRNDGSSVFGAENRYGWFPSVSGAWRLTQEKFLQQSNWLSELKLRASWGKSGFYGNTDPQNQYTLYGGTVADSYYDIYGINSGSIQQGFRVTRIGEPKTGWQEDVVTNAGIESVLWKGKLSATIDVYKKQSKGLLFQVALPDILGGATRPNINVGNVQNTGLDLLLSSEGKFSKDWSWNTTVTITTYKSRVIKINNLPYFDAPFNEAGDLIVRSQVGHPVGAFYGYKVTGFFNDSADVNKSPVQQDAAPGRFKYLDADGNDTINDKDRVFLGNPNPKFTAGINAGINYKNFDLSAFFYGSFGNDVMNPERAALDFYGSIFGPFLSAKSKTALYDSWTPQHKNATAPIQETFANFSTSVPASSYFLEDGSYFKCKVLTLGYTLSKKTLEKIRIEHLRIYLQAVNLFTVTKYSGLDPELSGHSDAFGIDFGNYPNNQKQYLIGLNVNF